MKNKPIAIDLKKLPLQTKISAHCFITSTMLKSLYENSPEFQEVSKSYYYPKMNIIVNRLLEHCNIKVLVDVDDYDYFYGYIIYKKIDEKTVKVYYTYIKFPHRKMGLATALIDKYCSDYKILYCFKTIAMLRWLKEGKNKGYNIEYVEGV